MPEQEGLPFKINEIDNSKQFQALFDFATIGIIVTNSKGAIINFNGFASVQFGYQKEEVIGSAVEILLPKNIHHKHVGYRTEFYKHPSPRAMGHGRDLYALKKDGTTFPVEVSLSHYKIGDETFVIAFVIDITIRKQHEQLMLQQTSELEQNSSEIKKLNIGLEQKVDERTRMLREALAELEQSKEELNEAYENEKELSELKSRFVTMASHEFRTPLSTILSSAFLLEKYNEVNQDTRIEKHLQRIKGAVGGMKNILEDFLSLGKLDEGLVQHKMEWFNSGDLLTMLNNLVQEMESLLKPGQQLIVEAPATARVYVDMYLLKNILVNLVSNAIKFTGENENIRIIPAVAATKLIISVQDNGIGISDDDQQHLAERFFRAKNAANIQGTGLGLHIVSKYLELMNGSLTIKSKLNEGSVFTIEIPQPQQTT